MAVGFEIDINLKWFRGISKPKRNYYHFWRKNKTVLLHDDVIIKLVLVATITDCTMFSCLAGNSSMHLVLINKATNRLLTQTLTKVGLISHFLR